jgi:transcription initiation factor TFIIB
MSQSPLQRHCTVPKPTDLQAESNCPECRGSLVVKGNEMRCDACGLIVDEQQIDHGPEWRTFGDTETNCR